MTGAAEHDGLSIELLIALLGGIFALVAVLAQRSRVPYPIFLVIAGLGIGYIPGVPVLELDPDLVFVIFLPALIYGSAYFISLNALRYNIRPISQLAIGLVLATTCTVAVVAHTLVDGMSWAVAFTLGAIVSPTDPVAGAAVLERMRVPPRILHIIEGESLINDGSGIVAYRVALAAVVSGSFSLWDAGLQFVVNVAGGIAVGIVAGVVLAWLRRRNEHGPTDVLLSLLCGYLAYLPAEALHVSGVLAAATTALWLGWRTPSIVHDAETRLQIHTIWVNVMFTLNTVLFLLVGLQMHRIVDALDGIGVGQLAWWTVAVVGTVMLTRLVWVYPNTYLTRVIPAVRRRDPMPNWKAVTLVGWIGMRGSVSLAAALAIPTVIDTGEPFPQRDLLVFLTFAVILGTLVVQGLSLPLLVRVLAMEDDDRDARSEAFARMEAARAVSDYLAARPSDGDPEHDESVRRMRGLHDLRDRRYEARYLQLEEAEGFDAKLEHFVQLTREVHRVQYETILRLRDEGQITDQVMERVQRDLDLEDLRLREPH